MFPLSARVAYELRHLKIDTHSNKRKERKKQEREREEGTDHKIDFHGCVATITLCIWF